MSDITHIYPGKQGRRPHYVPAWAEKRGYESQSQLAEAIGADKSVVSRWYSGSTPTREYQLKLAELFSLDGPEGLFRHPDEDWLYRFLRGRSDDEIARIKATIETAFPRKASPGR